MKQIIPPTELRNSNSIHIDKLTTTRALSAMLDDNGNAIKAIREVLGDIELVVKNITKYLSRNKSSRLIYAGAGTSGRIGVQDGAELYPTFGWPMERVDFFLAGGKKSLTSPVEGAEDDKDTADMIIKNSKLTKYDVVISIAASGNTPFTTRVAELANKIGSLTIGITNNPNGRILDFSKLSVVLNTGPEIIAGSTRLKAGTAQKICLNLISTIVMSNLGNVKNGEMINMVATNEKLIQRKKMMSDTSLKN